jgi:hypothetical protein
MRAVKPMRIPFPMAGQDYMETREAWWTNPGWVVPAVLFVAGIALRWWRLDLISFRFDAVEALARAREAVEAGSVPLTGIVNSLGFRNPGGFIWLILPSAVASPDPRFTAGWIGLLAMTGVFPLWWIGGRFAGGAVRLLPAVVYTFAPVCVFGSRSIWAQNLMPALGAWVLAFLLMALDFRAAVGRRGICAMLAAAFAALSVSVHLSGAAWMLLVLLALAVPVIRREFPARTVAGIAAVLVVAALSFLPVVADWSLRRSVPPVTKPDYVQKFESAMPEPKPFAGRVGDAVSGLFEPFSSLGATGGIDRQLGVWTAGTARMADFVLLAAMLAGMALAAMRVSGRFTLPASVDENGCMPDRWYCAVLVSWCLVPALLGAATMPYLNPTYFFPALPAMMLLAAEPLAIFTAWLHRRAAASRRSSVDLATAVVAVLIAVDYCAFQVATVRTLDRSRNVAGSYYIPLVEQERLVSLSVADGVGRNNFIHLGGDWFQRSYDYLFRHAPRRDDGGSGTAWAVAEDLQLRTTQKKRTALVEHHLPASVGTVRFGVFPDEGSAKEFANRFYGLPLD